MATVLLRIYRIARHQSRGQALCVQAVVDSICVLVPFDSVVHDVDGLAAPPLDGSLCIFRFAISMPIDDLR